MLRTTALRLLALHLLFAVPLLAQSTGRPILDSAQIASLTVPSGTFPNTWQIECRDGATLEDVGLLGVVGDTLALTSETVPPLRAPQVTMLSRRNGNHFWRGFAWGGGIMAPLAIAGLIVVEQYGPALRKGEDSMIILGFWLGSAVTGGLVGALFPRTEEVELSILPADERIVVLDSIAAADALERAEALEELREKEIARAEKAARKKKRVR